MYHSPTSFTPPLTPDCYHSAAVAERERVLVFQDAWHPVCLTTDVGEIGEFLTADVVGTPVVVRNFEGHPVALSNVCTHRYNLLEPRTCGRSGRLKCGYHGWEFGCDGMTRRIPAAQNFPQFDREAFRLNRYPLEQCGDLWFIRLSPTGPSLRDWMGDSFDLFQQLFSRPKFGVAAVRRVNYEANWKIPIEISLESYHIPEVHPTTFGEDPGEPRSLHFFTDNGSSFHAKLAQPRLVDRWLRICERRVLSFLGVESLGQYQHHHIYPNLLVSFTDSLSLVHHIMPTGPATSAAWIWQFARLPDKDGLLQRLTSAAWGRFTGYLTMKVLNEDRVMYPPIQSGTAAAERSGILGRCEERLYSFQKFVADRLANVESAD
ncbi:MAG: Rieske 2Fe-2S domain-containing protein [Planctomycetaceae bacterium]|nr:Rieske 2Fe-2S domain-containing protein [Planctomycetaceae bacterium]